MTRRHRLTCACLLLVASQGSGCGGPPAPVPPAGAPAGYEALRETFGPADFGPLRGRVVVLDPGHGGNFRGARGPNGLAEADVNLGVALHLRGLLEWANAEVHLTRTADRDFLTVADSTLAADLAFRVSFTDSIQPDVFLSIHHNSNATYDPTINETQTYHPLGADGASLDLARAVHRHLVRNLEIAPARILPGNFRVLRDATVPAVLGEPAMISHPGVADRLELAASQRLEAEAYFLGLLEYFGTGEPGWRAHQPDTVVVGPADADLRWTFAAERRPDVPADASPGPDPASFSLEMDGTAVPHRLSDDGATVQWTAPPLDGSAPTELVLRGRNLAGRAAAVRRTVLLPATGKVLRVSVTRDSGTAGAGRTLVRWVVAGGAPAPRGVLAWPAGARIPVGSAVVPEALLPTGELAGEPRFVADADDSAAVTVDANSLPAGWSWTPVDGPPPAVPWRTRLLADQPLPPPAGRTAIPVRSGAAGWWEAPGRQALAWHDEDDTSDRATFTTSALAPALEGLTVVIDPAGGGSETDGEGPTGLRGAEVNLGTARQLARLLRGYGAATVLTREGSVVPDAASKIALTERAGADFFLTVGRSRESGTVRVLHHPGSQIGAPWASLTAAPLARLLGSTAVVAVAPSWAYLLRHTSCPALEVRLPHATGLDDEQRLSLPAWQAAEARALLQGLATARSTDVLSHDPGWVSHDDRALARNGGPIRRSPVFAVFDGQVPWYPLPGSGSTDVDTVSSWGEPGLPFAGHRHVVEIHDGDRWLVLWYDERTGPTAVRTFRTTSSPEE